MKKKVLIFGAGTGGYRAFNYLKYKYRVIGFIDNNEKLQGKKLQGISISAPETIKSTDYDLIFIASMYRHEIKSQLEKLVCHNKHIVEINKEVIDGKYEKKTGCFWLTILGVFIYFLLLSLSTYYLTNINR